MTSTFQPDTILGCIIGGAIGDAMGSPYENMQPPVSLDPVQPLRLTDDTQLTLAVCESIVEHGSPNPEHIATSMLQWYKAGRVSGVGSSTLKAFRDLAAGAHWALAGRQGDMAAGNGAAMRSAPLAFCLDPHNDNERETIRDVCRITHHNDEAYVGALALIKGVRLAASFGLTSDFLSLVARDLPDTRVRDAILDLARAKPAPTIREAASRCGSGGFVAESLPLALFAAVQSSVIGFETMIHDLISCGGDTDTTASMAGNIAGAAAGFSRLPKNLVAGVPDYDEVYDIASRFAAFCRRWNAR